MNLLNDFTRVLLLLLFLSAGTVQAALEYNKEVVRKIIAGDMLQLTVEEQISLNNTYGVGSDGTISFGELGRAEVAERTIAEAELAVKKHLESKYFRQATVTISIAEYVNGEVILMGAVGGGGNSYGQDNEGILAAGNINRFTLQDGELLSLFDAVLKSGGLHPNANGKEVMIMRWKPGFGLQREIFTVDVHTIFADLAWEKDQFLRPKDIVYIPFLTGENAGGEILVLGATGANGYRRWRKDMSVLRLVATMGGLGAEGHNARILRPDGSAGYNVIPVDVGRLLGAADMSQNKELKPGDIFYVPHAGMADAGEAWISGEVAQPGPIGLPVRGEVNLARLIFERGYTKYANLRKVVVIRKDPLGEEQTITVNVKEILDEAAWEKDFPVQDGDRIIIKEAFIPGF